MKVGYGAGYFIFDLHDGVSTEEMRRRYAAGHYGKLREKDVKGWRMMAGRKS